jgi:pimeloyl-ACP methyl ester carboxylesterase
VMRGAARWRRALCVGAVLGVAHCGAPPPEQTGTRTFTDAALGEFSGDARRAYVLRTDSGDTIATELVDEGRGWMESALQLSRRGEQHRLFVTLDTGGAPLRWDVHSAWDDRRGRADERWRVLVQGDSLHVVQGALIGVPVSVTAVDAPPQVAPWHDASVALMELIARGAAPTVTAVSVPRAERQRRVGVQRVRADSVRLVHPDGDWFLSLDGAGHVARAASPSRRLQLERVPVAPAVVAVDRAGGAELAVEPVTLRTHDGVRLAGEFVRPRDTPLRSVVVFVSGSGPQDRDLGVPGLPRYRPFAELAEALAARGVGSVRMDDRGVGASGGTAFQALRADEVRDVQAVLGWLRGVRALADVPVALVGHSDGAHVVLDVAAADARVARVVLLAAPSRSGRELARAQRRAWLDGEQGAGMVADRVAAEQALRRAEAATEQLAALDPWMRDWLSHDPRVDVPTVRAEVLLVHGEQDRQVGVAQTEELAELLRARGAREVRVRREAAVNHLLLADSVGDPRGYGRIGTRALPPGLRDAIVQWIAR